MDNRRRNGGSYQHVILRQTNIRYVSDVTGKSMAELKRLLEINAAKGKYEVKLPIGLDYFTRGETHE